jgi:hypothetical protein
MKTIAIVMMLALAGQPGAPAVAGTWTAEFQGRTFVRLQLQAAKETFTGGMTIGDVEFDKTGALKKVGEPPRDLIPIFDVTQKGSTIRFSRRESSDIDRFELRVLEGGRAELRLLLSDEDVKELAEEGIPVPKPIVLTRK